MTSVVDGGVIERKPARCGATVVGVDPVRLILVPREHGVLTAGLLGEQLVEVECHPLTAELLGNRLADPLEHVALPLRVVHPRQHHIEDRVVRRVGPELARHHVVQVASDDVDLATHERVVDRIERGELVLGQDPREVDVAVLGEAASLVLGDDVPISRTMSHVDERRGQRTTGAGSTRRAAMIRVRRYTASIDPRSSVLAPKSHRSR